MTTINNMPTISNAENDVSSTSTENGQLMYQKNDEINHHATTTAIPSSQQYYQQATSQQQQEYIPPSIVMTLRKHISLVRTSTGRDIWWIDNISSHRREGMMKRRMKYLQWEYEKKNATAVIREDGGEVVVDGTHAWTGEYSYQKQMGSQKTNDISINTDDVSCEPTSHDGLPQPSTSSEVIPNRSNTYRHGNNDTANNCDKEQLNSNVESYNDENEPNAISLDDEITMPTQFVSQCKVYDNIPVVQLSNNITISSKYQTKTYLDFGEGNIVGKMSYQTFAIQANGNDNNEEEEKEFHIKLNWCTSNNKGILCSMYTNTTHSSNHTFQNVVNFMNHSTEERNFIQFTVKGGETKMVHVRWNPVEKGCMREKIDLEVTNNSMIWKQMVVVVGEALDNHDGNNEELSNTTLMESNAVSEITNTLNYSDHGSSMFSVITDTVGYHLSGNITSEQDNILEEQKLEEESLSIDLYSQQSQRGLSMTDDDKVGMKREVSMEKPMWNGAMVSLELSEIEEMDDNDTYEEDVSNVEYYAAHKMNEIGTSFSSSSDPVFESSVAVIPLAPIDESKSISSSECEDLRLDDVTEMFDHLDVLPEKPPQDEVRGSEMDEGMKQDTQYHDTSAVELVVSSAEKMQQELHESLVMEETENEQFLAEEERARLFVSQEYEQQKNDFEVLLAAEGLVDVGDTATDDSRETGVKFIMDGLFNADDNDSYTSKSPSFGSLSSDDSFDCAPAGPPVDAKIGHHLQVINEDQPETSVSSLATCLAEVQDYLVNSPDDDGSDSADLSPSPSEQLYPGVHKSLTKMMEQASDDVDSPLDDSVLLNIETEQSELTAFIDEISEVC